MDRIIQAVPEGLDLDFLLFSLYLKDLFFLVGFTEICKFADGTRFFACDKDFGSLINRSEHTSYLLFEWFQNNYMKLNEDHYEVHKYESILEKLVRQKLENLVSRSH